ncbi:MAG: amino acid permease [Candidatus Eremiobacteraeota bacterium]|nr:amino acid permease [Candidatus Eremiobacteraeota bacterium]
MWAAAALVICNVIGQGVFLKARAMTCDIGSPQLVLTAWVVAGVLALCGSLTFAELGAMIPDSGGPYAYLRRAFGPPAAFAYGWMMFFLGGPLAAAALAAGGAIFLNLLSGGALESLKFPYAVAGLHGSLAGTQLAALLLLAAVAFVNLARVRTNGAIATALAVVKILMLVCLTVGAFALGSGSFAHFALDGSAGTCAGIATSTRGGAAGFVAAMVGALYAYQGWASLTFVAGEVKDPGRTLPRALIASMIVVIVVYTAANATYFYVLTPAAVASVSPASSVGLQVLGHIFGSNAQGIATALLFLSVLATLHVSILTNSRITYALAADRDLLPWLSRLNAATHVPGRTVFIGATLAAVLVLLGSFDALSDFQVFSVWVFYSLTALTLFVLRRREPDAPRPYRTFGYPFVPAAFVVAAVYLLVETVVGTPLRSLVGLGVIALGVPAYYLLRMRAERRVV